MQEIYIYYRVLPGQEQHATDVMKALQADLVKQHPGLQARLLQRVDTAQVPGISAQTWMEIYTHPSGINAELLTRIQAAVQQAQFDPLS